MGAKQAKPKASRLPGLPTLEKTAGILAALLESAPREALAWKPAPERWSISEVLAHLTDVEKEFHQRARQMVAEDKPRLASYDQNAKSAAGAYAGKDGRKMLGEFRRERGRSLAFLRRLAGSAVRRKAVHPVMGEVTLRQMMHEWGFHDLGHIRQIAELYRAKIYWPGMGGWQRYYKINP